jgi:hypothetical protein
MRMPSAKASASGATLTRMMDPWLCVLIIALEGPHFVVGGTRTDDTVLGLDGNRTSLETVGQVNVQGDNSLL